MNEGDNKLSSSSLVAVQLLLYPMQREVWIIYEKQCVRRFLYRTAEAANS
jgi:hypothetical protein